MTNTITFNSCCKGFVQQALMRVAILAGLAFNLNAALDTGKYTNLTTSDVTTQIESGSIFEFLSRRLGKDIDLSLLDDSKKKELVAEWQGLLSTVSASRKFGVEKIGLCLLIAFLLEGIQSRHDDKPYI